MLPEDPGERKRLVLQGLLVWALMSLAAWLVVVGVLGRV